MVRNSFFHLIFIQEEVAVLNLLLLICVLRHKYFDEMNANTITNKVIVLLLHVICI
jgi:hypothetical protein